MEDNVIVPKSSTAASILSKAVSAQNKAEEAAMVPFEHLLQKASKQVGYNADRPGDDGELGQVVDHVVAKSDRDGGAGARDGHDDGADEWTPRPHEAPPAHRDDQPPPRDDAPPRRDEDYGQLRHRPAQDDGGAPADFGQDRGQPPDNAQTANPANTPADGSENQRNQAVAGMAAAANAAAPAQQRAAPESAVARAVQATTPVGQAAAAQQQTAAVSPEARKTADPTTATAQSRQPGTLQARAVGANPAQQAQAAAQAGQQQPNAAAQQQAADLSARLDPGQRAQVSVTVTDEGASLASQPRSTLSAPTVAATGNNGNTNNGAAQGQNNHGAAPQQAGAQGQQAAALQANAQAAAQAPTQTQVMATNGAKAGGSTTIQATSATTTTAGGDPTAQGGPGTTSETRPTQQTAAAQAQKAATANRPPIAEQVSVHIAKAVRAGVDRIHIQLKPHSMGRVDVQMEIAQDGRVTAVVTVDNRETLNLLQKDSQSLEQALRDAGLQADSDDLEFQLRGEQAGDETEAKDRGQSADADGDEEGDAGEGDDGIDETALLLARARGLAGRVDIRA